MNKNVPSGLIGMVHVQALPGTPKNTMQLKEVVKKACEEAIVLQNNGIDAIIIENMHDHPYLQRSVGPEIVASMTAIGAAIRGTVGESFPLGIQVLCGANKEAIAIALAWASFVRVDGFCFSHVSVVGLFQEAEAGPLLRYRKHIGAEEIAILADVKKKHSSHAITSDLSIGDMAREAEFCCADGVIVTGISTGYETDPDHVKEAHENTQIPVLVGSGITAKTLPHLYPFSNGFIVGSI